MRLATYRVGGELSDVVCEVSLNAIRASDDTAELSDVVKTTSEDIIDPRIL